jgi:Replication protein
LVAVRDDRRSVRTLAAADPDTPERQRQCGVVPVGDQVEIRIKDGSAYYCGLETCGSVWLCPVCSAKIHHRRAAELRETLDTWTEQRHSASLITITIPHDLDDQLSTLLGAQKDAWKDVTQGAAWQRLKRRLGIAEHVIALEFTWADENGWHPHHHVLLVHDQDLGAAAIAALHAHIHSRLAAACHDAGLRQPGQLHAVRIDPNVSAAGAYIAKRRQLDTRRVDASRGHDPRRPQDEPHRQPHTLPDPRGLFTRPATLATAISGTNTPGSPAAWPPCAGHAAYVH